ncbi:MAG: hypothetical protein Ct9H90mP5_08170 [Acidimicrobiaceae bacterium]|nr:MAG: hypothetical protein Ct9H90mP5_08170 [Acidimicrobiaceae bacterium]
MWVFTDGQKMQVTNSHTTDQSPSWGKKEKAGWTFMFIWGAGIDSYAAGRSLGGFLKKTFLTSTSPRKGSMPPIYKVPGHFPHIGGKEADLSD